MDAIHHRQLYTLRYMKDACLVIWQTLNQVTTQNTLSYLRPVVKMQGEIWHDSYSRVVWHTSVCIVSCSLCVVHGEGRGGVCMCMWCMCTYMYKNWHQYMYCPLRTVFCIYRRSQKMVLTWLIFTMCTSHLSELVLTCASSTTQSTPCSHTSGWPNGNL